MYCVLFQEFIENIFKISADLGVRNESTVKSVIFPRRRFWNPFQFVVVFMLTRVEYIVKNFIRTRQYLVHLTFNCWFSRAFRMCTQFHQILGSYKCMLFVDCLVVLREYFVNWARVTKFNSFLMMMMMMMSWCLMSSDVIWHIRDKLWPMPKHGSIKATYVRCMRV